MARLFGILNGDKNKYKYFHIHFDCSFISDKKMNGFVGPYPTVLSIFTLHYILQDMITVISATRIQHPSQYCTTKCSMHF
jgi:hypothetical protein